MKKTLLTLLTLTLCFALIKAEEEFKYQNMYYVYTSDSTVKLTKGYKIGDIVIPDTIKKGGKNYAVTEIGSGAFLEVYLQDAKITSVVIPATIEIIRSQAFSGQSKIKDIYFLGDQHITFEDHNFSVYDNYPRRIHVNSFESWCNMTYPTNSNLGSLGANPFSQAYMYINGEEVDTVRLRNISKISNCAFEGIRNNLTIICDTGLVSIGKYAFMESNIQAIELPSSLVTIGENAFKRSSIKSVIIPENVQSFGYYVFEYCSSLRKIIWKAKSLHVDYSRTATAAFHITSSNLDTLIIDTGVVSLPELMFYSTFYAAKPIIISYNKNVPMAYYKTFQAIDKNSSLYVPKGKANEYRTAWGFTNVYEMEDEETDIQNVSYPMTEEKTHMIIEDGKILILRGDKTYTLTGQEVR